MTAVESQANIPVMVLDDELIDMVNLTEQDTGVGGMICISTLQGSHGARIKWYPDCPAREAPCLAVTIGAAPQMFNQNLPARIASAASGPVSRWVALNHAALLDFRNDGVSWTRSEVSSLPDGLAKLG